MLEAALFGAFAQSALLVGALLVWKFPAMKKPVIVGGLMAFGAGAVISAVTIDLVAVNLYPFRETVAGQPEVTSRLSPAELDAIFEAFGLGRDNDTTGVLAGNIAGWADLIGVPGSYRSRCRRGAVSAAPQGLNGDPPAPRIPASTQPAPRSGTPVRRYSPDRCCLAVVSLMPSS